MTGGVAAGKSEALRAFARLGAATVSSDQLVHDLLDSAPLTDRIRERWGDSVFDGDRVDRSAVGERVFSDPDELAWLEAEVHPLVRGEIASWVENARGEIDVAVVEVPLLFESEFHDRFDATIAIVADEQTRRSRAEARGQAGLEGREGRQLTQDEKAAMADHVVVNDGTTAELEEELRGLLIGLGVGLPADPAG